MHSEYIEQRNGGYYVAGTRISLDSVACSFNQGNSPERILEQFPLLGKIGRVYGAIAFYLDHKAELDEYLEEAELKFAQEQGPPLSEENPELWARLQRAKTELAGTHPGASRS
jgi:uncharacterized protein (DUF433 family)